MFRRAQIVGFFLLLVALMTGTTWLAQAGDDDSPDVDSPDVTAITTSESPTTQPSTTTPDTTSPDTSTSEVTTTSTHIETTSTASTSLPETTTTSSTTTEHSTTAAPTETAVIETTTEPSTTSTEPAIATTEANPTTVKVRGQAGLRLGDSIAPGPNLLRLNFFDQQTDERVQSIVYTGLTNTGDYSADLRTDITYRVDVIVCCNAPTVTLSFRDLSFEADTTLDLTVPAVEVVFEVVSETGGPVANATIVIPAASGSNAHATWSARVYAAPTGENGETRTVLPIGTTSNEDRLPTLELEDGVKTTFQFTVLGGPGTDVAGPTEPVPTTLPATTAPPASVPTTSTSTITSVPTTTDTTTTDTTTTDTTTTIPTTTIPTTTIPTTTVQTIAESTTTETSATTTETTLFAALDEDPEDDTEITGPTPSTESATSETIAGPTPTITIPSTTSSAPGPTPATTVNAEPTTTTQPESPTTTELATSQTTLRETTILAATSAPTTGLPDTSSPDTTTPDTTTPDTTGPNTPTSDVASPDNPDPIAPTPDGTNTVRITLIAPTSIELSGKAGLEILGELTPGSHSLRISFYRADTDELGAQVTYTGESNDGSYETHLIAGAAYRVEVIVCCEGPTVHFGL